MRLTALARTIAVSGVLSLAGASAALAADGTISDTGPGSTNTVSNNSTSTVAESNSNNISVTNNNSQSGSSGSASVSSNTSGGSAISGDVTNSSTVTTTISIGNSTAGLPGMGGSSGSGSGDGSGSGAGAGSGSGSSSSDGPGKGSGAGLGAGDAVSTLPTVGCEIVCDVSALRNAYHQPTSTDAAVKQAKGISSGLMALAGLLSLVGAGGSALFATKRAKA